VRLTKHARNRARLYGITQAEVKAVAAWGQPDGVDERGNPCRIDELDGRRIRVIIALDDPELIITVYPRNR
jgi:hypothetical protein